MTDKDSVALAGLPMLVTGATGIVGGWLVHRLLELRGDVVVLLRDEPVNSELFRSGDISRVTRVRGGLEDGRLLQRVLVEYDVRLVFHLGAQTQVVTADRDPLGTLESNVRGTYQLLEAARRQGAAPAVVVASSDKAYGPSPNLPYTEDHPLSGRGIYEASKSAADLVSSSYATTYRLPIAIARCGNIYGGGDLNWDRIVPGTIRSLLAGERPVLRSDGRPRRDYLYVRDAVGGYLRLADALLAGDAAGEAFNFGHNVPVSVLEIVDELRRITNREDVQPIVLGGAAGEIPDQYLDASKAAKRLNWRPAFDLRDGLNETVAWYRDLLGQ
jgi:CDP-glucose 4,6-dehydratase